MSVSKPIEILTCYQTANRCYQRGRKAKHVGILVHSTGAVNRNLCRYVDSPERLGKNKYGNHWNKPESDKCMHGFIGYDKDGTVIVANTLPYDFACWGCGKGSNGSYNYDPTAHIQFEICQGSNTDATYYKAAIDVAAEYCSHLCRLYGWTSANICSHREAARAGYASNHGDPERWMRCFGDDMTQFRARVDALLYGLPGEYTVVDAGDAETGAGSDLPTVRKGSKGEAVVRLQNALMALGYPLAYGADGGFGAETLAAVEQLQQDSGLAVDGVCGPKTWAAITAGLDGKSGDDDAEVSEEITYTIQLLDATEAERAAIVAACGRVTVAQNVG